jgi:capsular polysaccharide biosynthesis protein
MGKNKEKYDFEAKNLIAYVAKRFKTLLIITILGAFITGIITIFIHNKYKSSLVLFPSSPASVARSISDINYIYSKGDLLSVGGTEEVDELMQVLNSNEIIAGLIEKYKLADHYRINLNKKGAYTRLYKKVSSNIKISRTEYSSVIIEVWDEKPDTCFYMANEIMSLADTVFSHMQRERLQKAFVLAQNAYDSVYRHIGKIQDSLTKINKLGILDYQYQTQEITKAYYNALMAGKTDLANTIHKQIKVLEDYGSKTMTLRDQIAYSEKNLGDLGAKLTVTKVALNSTISQKFVVSKPGKPDYKDYPKRMLIVLVSAISTFFVALFSFIIVDNIKKIL